MKKGNYEDGMREINVILVSMLIAYTILSVIAYLSIGEINKGVQWMLAWVSIPIAVICSKIDKKIWESSR